MSRFLIRIGKIALTLFLFFLVQSSSAKEKSPAQSNKQRFARIIQQVRENEKRYQNLETVIRRTITIPEKFTAGWKFSKTEETYRTVLQGDLLYFGSRREPAVPYHGTAPVTPAACRLSASMMLSVSTSSPSRLAACQLQRPRRGPGR